LVESKNVKKTSISTDKLQAVTGEPPTTIIEERYTLDPQKVISAWLASAEVLREVAQAVRENQADNLLVREVLLKTRRWLLWAGICISMLQVMSVALVLHATHSAEMKIRVFVKDQTKVTQEVREEARRTRKESEKLRAEAQALTQALAATMSASLAREQGAPDAPQKVAEAELTVAAVQVQVAGTPERRKLAEERVQAAVEKAKEAQVDPQVLQGL
jgi:Skp family chaperone for outer membrane proteins